MSGCFTVGMSHFQAVVLILVPDCMSYRLKGKKGSSWPDGKDSSGNVHGRECSYQRTQSITDAPAVC